MILSFLLNTHLISCSRHKLGLGGYYLIWPIHVSATEQGTIFRILCLKQRTIQFHYLQQGVFLD